MIRPGRFLPPDLALAARVRWLHGTLAEAPWAELHAFGPEVCLHAAWISTPGVYLESPENRQWVMWSLDFLRGVLDAGAERLVVLGTCAEYQIGPEPLVEEHTPLVPSTLYARCKRELHLRLAEELAQEQATLCWARLFTLYGPGEHPARLCTSVIRSLIRNEPITLRTPDTKRDYVYIDDVARALLRLVEGCFAGPINVGSGQAVSVRELGEKLGRLLGKPELVRFSEPATPDPLSHAVADVSRLRSLGWRPEVGLDEGLPRLVKHLTG